VSRSLAPCGTRTRYVRGCRCSDCTRAQRLYRQDRDVGAETEPRSPFYFGCPPPGPWAAEGACRGLEPEIFFPTRGEGVKDALAICATCLVVDPCRDYAVANFVKWGIWGGTTERARRRIRFAQRRAAAS
jgi:WhiB family transcriptional regulator, redox-sensing transcriptional regulator